MIYYAKTTNLKQITENRPQRLAQLKRISDACLAQNKTWSEIRDILDLHMVKQWYMSYNSRLDYLHTVDAMYQETIDIPDIDNIQA